MTLLREEQHHVLKEIAERLKKKKKLKFRNARFKHAITRFALERLIKEYQEGRLF